MLFEVWMLVGSATLAPWVKPARAPQCAVWVTTAAIRGGASLSDALTAAEWAARESGCDPSIVSPDGLDCGLMQLRGPMRRGLTCEAMANDPTPAVGAWLEDLEELRGVCGTTRAALGALASGHCGGAQTLVRSRCRQAGGVC